MVGIERIHPDIRFGAVRYQLRLSGWVGRLAPDLGRVGAGTPGILLGGLIQNPVSYAYTRDRAQASSALFVQPIVSAYIGKGFYLKSADSTR